jgi:hypothetical protein
MAKKNSFDMLKERPELVKAGAEAVKESKASKTDKDKRKLLQVPPDAHALAKKVSALDGIGLAEYVAKLIHDDAGKRYPNLVK